MRDVGGVEIGELLAKGDLEVDVARARVYSGHEFRVLLASMDEWRVALADMLHLCVTKSFDFAFSNHDGECAPLVANRLQDWVNLFGYANFASVNYVSKVRIFFFFFWKVGQGG